MLPVFEELLSPYPTPEIISAFKTWLKTQRAMPTPADILAIIREDLPSRPTRPEHVVFQPKTKEERTAEQKAAVAGYVKRCREMLGKIKKAPKGETPLPEYSPEERAIKREIFVDEVLKLRAKRAGIGAEKEGVR